MTLRSRKPIEHVVRLTLRIDHICIYPQLELADFQKVAVLGAGAFGQVLLVKQGSKYYALKVLSKAHLLQTGLHVRFLYPTHTLNLAACECEFCSSHVCNNDETAVLWPPLVEAPDLCLIPSRTMFLDHSPVLRGCRRST